MSGLTRKPRVGERLTYRGERYGVVDHFGGCNGNICYVLQDGAKDATCFIWRFESDDTLNKLFTIEGKALNTEKTSTSNSQPK